MSKDTTIRVISAIIGIIIFFAVMFAPPIIFDIAIGIVVLMMIFELFGVFKFTKLAALIGIVASAAIFFCVSREHTDSFMLTLLLYIATLTALAVFDHEKMSLTNICAMLFSTLYVSVFTSFIPRLYKIDEFGLYFMLLIFVCAWLTDTGAYFSGRFFGKHKLSPTISPKKTIEGSIGGIICSIISCMILGLVAKLISDAQPNYLILGAVGLVGSVLSQIGDLTASLIKRSYGAKDFGNIMPGHGGMLDRFDSVIMAAPFIFMVYSFCSNFGINIL